MNDNEHPLVGVLTGSDKPVNRQEYRNNPVANSPETQDYLASETRFAGDRDPNLGIQVEKAEHRIIMFLKAQGKSGMEIAKITGYSYQWVLQVCRQPWFKKRLLETLQEAGGDAVATFIQGEVLPSLVVLAEIRDDIESKDSTRVAACNSILDRGLGKPIQHIKTEKVSDIESAQGEMSDLERELAQIKQAQVAAGVIRPGSQQN